MTSVLPSAPWQPRACADECTWRCCTADTRTSRPRCLWCWLALPARCTQSLAGLHLVLAWRALRAFRATRITGELASLVHCARAGNGHRRATTGFQRACGCDVTPCAACENLPAAQAASNRHQRSGQAQRCPRRTACTLTLRRHARGLAVRPADRRRPHNHSPPIFGRCWARLCTWRPTDSHGNCHTCCKFG